jgi:U6 snRNA-associated Sm-like protein LSm6
MNLALEKCEEYVDGVKKRSYGDAFVRGNNGRRKLSTEGFG